MGPVLEALGGHLDRIGRVTRAAAPAASIWTEDARSVLLRLDPTEPITSPGAKVTGTGAGRLFAPFGPWLMVHRFTDGHPV
jgi:hypothetical protein